MKIKKEHANMVRMHIKTEEIRTYAQNALEEINTLLCSWGTASDADKRNEAAWRGGFELILHSVRADIETAVYDICEKADEIEELFPLEIEE